MPTVSFLAGPLGPAVIAEAPDGGRLLDVCDEAHAPVSFSCRSASCGICRVAVLAGAELLAPPSADEREVLAIFGAAADERLACQAAFGPGAGLIQLRWIEDDVP